MRDGSPMYPETGRIFVGSRQASPLIEPLIEGYTPSLGTFSCSPDVADRLAEESRAAAAAVRAAMKAGK